MYIRNLSRALRDLGHDVDVISGPPDPCLDKDIGLIQLPCLDLYNPKDPFRIPKLTELVNPVNFLEWVGVSTMGFPEPFTFGIRAYEYLKGRYHKYDIVHDNQSLSYGLWSISKFIPTVATVHHPITVDRKIAIQSAKSVWEKMKHLRWYSFVGMQKQVAKNLSHIITVSNCGLHDVARDFNIPSGKFRVVPNGIDIKRFRPLSGIRRKKNRVIVTSSSDTPLKGLRFLLHAAALVSQANEIEVIVVGNPAQKNGIEMKIRELGIGQMITFTGNISNEEFVKHYAKATMAVVPSVYEGFGLPVGEAMACRVPVISTTGGALPEVVGDAGILVPPGDSVALAEAIKTVLNNPGLARSYGEAGFQRVRNHFTWKNAAKRTLSVYKEVIDDYNRLQAA